MKHAEVICRNTGEETEEFHILGVGHRIVSQGYRSGVRVVDLDPVVVGIDLRDNQWLQRPGTRR